MAMNMAIQSTMCFKHGAVITYGSRVMGRGCNSDRTRYRTVNTTSMHAEVMATLTTARTMRGADMYVVRLRGSDMAYSRPCAQCVKWMRKMGIRRVYYSTGIPDSPCKMELVCKMAMDYVTPSQKRIGR